MMSCVDHCGEDECQLFEHHLARYIRASPRFPETLIRTRSNSVPAGQSGISTWPGSGQSAWVVGASSRRQKFPELTSHLHLVERDPLEGQMSHFRKHGYFSSCGHISSLGEYQICAHISGWRQRSCVWDAALLQRRAYVCIMNVWW
jgi:hypothetical protein